MYKSKQIEKYQTYSLSQWKDEYYTYKGTVTYGMHYILGNSQPYFSITGSTERRRKNGDGEVKWFEDSGGCIHDLIKEKAPHLAPLIPFHLSSQDGLPMYYLENGYYWFKENNLEVFKDYVRLSENEEIPEVPDIELPVVLNDNGTEIDLPEKEQKKIIEAGRKKFITDWLKMRIPKLKQEFDEAMSQFEVEYISSEEINTLKG